MLPEIKSAECYRINYISDPNQIITGVHMINNPRARHISAVIMIVAGVALMILTPETWPGALLLVLGIVLELFGIALEHKSK